MSWPSVELGQFSLNRGGAVNPEKHLDEVFDLFSIPAYDSGVPEVVQGADIGSSKKIVEPGDVLLSKIVPHIRRVWIVGENRGRRQIASGEWIVYRTDKVNPDYLRYFLLADSFRVRFMGTVKGVGGSLLRATPSLVDKIEIPLPPLEIQKQIAAVLEKADQLRKDCQKMEQELKNLAQSVFMDMFGDPATNSMEWNTAELLDVCHKVTDGTHQSPEWADNGVPFLFISHVRDGRVDFNTGKYITHKCYKELTRTSPIEVNDILYTTVGSYGHVAIVREDFPEFCFQRHIAHIKPNEKLINPEFLYLQFQTPGIKHLADAAVKGVAQKTLNLKELKKFRILLPPENLQAELVQRIKDIEAYKILCALQKNQMHCLFDSIVQKAYSGNLSIENKAA